jgi:hypothetical protein
MVTVKTMGNVTAIYFASNAQLSVKSFQAVRATVNRVVIIAMSRRRTIQYLHVAVLTPETVLVSVQDIVPKTKIVPEISSVITELQPNPFQVVLVMDRADSVTVTNLSITRNPRWSRIRNAKTKITHTITVRAPRINTYTHAKEVPTPYTTKMPLPKQSSRWLKKLGPENQLVIMRVFKVVSECVRGQATKML